jgi:hypothetical protein
VTGIRVLGEVAFSFGEVSSGIFLLTNRNMPLRVFIPALPVFGTSDTGVGFETISRRV